MLILGLIFKLLMVKATNHSNYYTKVSNRLSCSVACKYICVFIMFLVKNKQFIRRVFYPLSYIMQNRKIDLTLWDVFSV